jgi:hypothetical protein
MMRELAGKELGLGSVSIAAIELFVLDAVLTRPASGSVPVFTDQRSTPQVAALTPLGQTSEVATSAASSERHNQVKRIIRGQVCTAPTTPHQRSVIGGQPPRVSLKPIDHAAMPEPSRLATAARSLHWRVPRAT